MNKEFIKERLEICKEEEIMPFFKEKVIPILEKIEDIETPYLYFSPFHELVLLEYEKFFDKYDSNIVSIEFYENGNVEIFFIKRRTSESLEIPMDEVIIKYDEVIEYINTICKKFINDKTNDSYKIEKLNKE